MYCPWDVLRRDMRAGPHVMDIQRGYLICVSGLITTARGMWNSSIIAARLREHDVRSNLPLKD